MKNFVLLITLLACSTATYAGKSLDSLKITVNNKNYMLHIGDTLQLGYGANMDGSFMFITNGPKQLGGKKGVIKKIKYFKGMDQYLVYVKIKAYGVYYMNIMQCLDKKEITGLNGIIF